MNIYVNYVDYDIMKPQQVRVLIYSSSRPDYSGPALVSPRPAPGRQGRCHRGWFSGYFWTEPLGSPRQHSGSQTRRCWERLPFAVKYFTVKLPQLKLAVTSPPSSYRKRTSCPPGSCWRCSPPPRGQCSRAPGSPGWWGRHRRGPPPRKAPHFSPSGLRLNRVVNPREVRYLRILRLQHVCDLWECHRETGLRHGSHSQLLS